MLDLDTAAQKLQDLHSNNWNWGCVPTPAAIQFSKYVLTQLFYHNVMPEKILAGNGVSFAFFPRMCSLVPATHRAYIEVLNYGEWQIITYKHGVNDTQTITLDPWPCNFDVQAITGLRRWIHG